MSAPDFYFAINAIFRHIHDRLGKAALVRYWRDLGREYYAQRWQAWRDGGLPAIARDWEAYFAHEPGADVHITPPGISGTPDRVTLEVRTCPAIAHLRKHQRDIPDYFCEHCDHICSSMAQASGHRFERQGGMGSCTQHFTPITLDIPSRKG